MKKNLFSTLAFVSIAGSALAQLPVSTAPENKKAVLEEFTGIHCGYCPNGHEIANNIKNADPNNVVLINIHSGGYATAATGEQDFKTAEGTAIDGMSGMGITGYPAGTMNREVFTGGVMAGSRSLWSGWANTIKSQPAYCNVALQGVVNVQTRVLTVTAEVYYTASSPVASNSLHIMLLESDIPGIQSNYGNPLYNAANYNADGTYNHNHVLRKALTPTFGMTIPVTTAGTTFSTTLTYTVPLTYGASGKTTSCMLGNIELVAFVTETNVKTINANRGPVTLTNFASSLDAGTNALKTDANVCEGINFGSSFKFVNNGSTAITAADFDYAVNGVVIGTYNWTGNVNPLTSSAVIDIPAFSFAPGNTNTLTVTVASVNGGSDQNAANNVVSKNIPFAPVASDIELEFNFTQDWYGSESSWSIVDELTNTVLIDVPLGTYSNLGSGNPSAPGTLLHTYTFTANYSTCYKIIVGDTYGDGINTGSPPNGAGVGGWNLRVNGFNVVSSNGQYGYGEETLFKTDAAPTVTFVGIGTAAMNINSVNLFPNPASGLTNLSVNLRQNETVHVSVLNSLGQEVYTSKGNNLAAGQNNIKLDTESWASGVYFINVSTVNGSVKRKLTVVH